MNRVWIKNRWQDCGTDGRLREEGDLRRSRIGESRRVAEFEGDSGTNA